MPVWDRGSKRSYGVVGWIVIAVILSVFFAPLTLRFLRGAFSKTATVSPLGGNWIGVVDITDGYDDWLGASPGIHKKAAIRFNLKMYDAMVNKYAGPGEMHIQGEAQARQIKILDIFLDMEDEPGVSGMMAGDWGPKDRGANRHAHDFKAVLHGNDLLLIQDDPLGLQFKGMLHRGSDAEYEELYTTIH